MDFSSKIYLSTRFAHLMGKLEQGPCYDYDDTIIIIAEEDLSKDEAELLLGLCRQAVFPMEVTLHINLEVRNRVLYEFGFHLQG